MDKTFTKIFTTMPRNQHQLLPLFQTGHIITCLLQQTFQFSIQLKIFLYMIHYPIQSINHRISGNYNLLLFYTFSQQILLAQRCRREVIGCDTAGNLPIHFLRPRTINIVSTQTRFYMPHWDLLVKSR